MVNQNKGKEYNPTPVYNRKLVRSIIRAGYIKKYGNSKVNKNLSENFHRIKAGA